MFDEEMSLVVETINICRKNVDITPVLDALSNSRGKASQRPGVDCES
jgi:hypothetical protein